MNAVLSVQGASAPVKRSRFFQIHSSEYASPGSRSDPAAVLMMFFPPTGDGRRQQWSGPDGKR